MKSRILALFGVSTYILSVLTSAENLQGESTISPILILISGIASLIFVIVTTIYLWKYSKILSSIFLLAFILDTGSAIMSSFNKAADGSMMILFMNMTKVFYFIVFVWTIYFLLKSKSTITTP